MKVSVITVYYNREQYVDESIRSLLNQTYEHMEIIAVDDGSTDQTFQKLTRFNDPRLKVYTHANQGFVKSIREAIQNSTGDLIAIHGSGDISLPTRIEKQTLALIENPNIGVVGCYIDEINIVNGQKRKRRPQINKHINLTDQVIKDNPFTQGEVMFRRDVYEQAGGYREFFKYAQDRDLWLRMSLITDFHVIEEVLYNRLTLPGGVSQSVDKVILQKYLSNFACQCIKLRRKGRPDLLEQYGPHAVFYRQRDAAFAYELLWLSIYAWVHGDTKKALEINRMSMQEKINIFNIIQKCILNIAYRSNPADSLFKGMLKAIGYGKRGTY